MKLRPRDRRWRLMHNLRGKFEMDLLQANSILFPFLGSPMEISTEDTMLHNILRLFSVVN